MHRRGPSTCVGPGDVLMCPFAHMDRRTAPLLGASPEGLDRRRLFLAFVAGAASLVAWQRHTTSAGTPPWGQRPQTWQTASCQPLTLRPPVGGMGGGHAAERLWVDAVGTTMACPSAAQGAVGRVASRAIVVPFMLALCRPDQQHGDAAARGSRRRRRFGHPG